MSSKEPELSRPKNEKEKDSLPQPTTPLDTPEDEGDPKDKPEDSNPITDTTPKDCGDNNKEKTDDLSKPAELIKSTDFDDEDEFNSDELHLRWDDDDEAVCDDKPNVKELDNSISKHAETENPSTSLVTAVKELENALSETSSANVCSLGKDENDTVDKEAEGNSSKEILDDIDKLIGNDEIDKAENNATDQSVTNIMPTVVEKSTDDVMSSILETGKTDNHNEISVSRNKEDAGSASSSQDICTNDASESNKPKNTVNQDESTESLEIINESSLLSSTVNESFLEASKIEHGLKKPDMMLEIPTQELIDCMDDFDSENEKSDEKVSSVDVSKQICSLDEDIDDKILDTEKMAQELIQTKNNSETSRDQSSDEKVCIQEESKKKGIHPKSQDSEMSEEKTVKDTSKLTVQDVKEEVTKSNESEIGMIDQQIEDNTSELYANEQTFDKNHDDANMEESSTKTIQDSISDVEMCDVSEREKAVLPTNKEVETEGVSNTIKTFTGVSSMKVDEIKTPEKELIPTLISKELHTHYNKEQTLLVENIETQSQVKSCGQPPLEESTKQTNKIVEKMDISEQKPIASEITDTQSVVNENSDTNAAILNKLEVDAKLLSVKELEGKQEIKDPLKDTKPTVCMEISLESDVKEQVGDIKTITPRTESAAPIIDQKYVKNEQLSASGVSQTDTPKLEHSSTSEEIKESLNVEPETENQSSNDASTLEPKKESIPTAIDEATTSNDRTKAILTPTLVPVSSEESKETVLDEPSTSSTEKLPLDQEVTDPKDPVLELPSSVESKSKEPSNDETTAPIFDPVTTEQTSKGSVLDMPSTSAESTSKTPLNDISAAPVLDPTTADLETKQDLALPSTSLEHTPKDTSNDKVKSPILEPITKSKDPSDQLSTSTVSSVSKEDIDQPSTSKAVENQDPVSDVPSAPKPVEKQDQVSDMPSTSKPVDEPLDDIPSTSKAVENQDQVSDMPSTSKAVENQDQVQDMPSTSKPVDELLDDIPSTSKVVDEPLDQIPDVPSTSKPVEKQDQIPDTTDEVPEMEDSLGLLAESSRMVDADAEGSSEGGEPEDDEEGDDDDDFDPDDESSNQITAEHSEESNAQPDKDDGQAVKEDRTPEEEKQFNFAIAAVATTKEDDAKTDVSTETSKASDKVTVPTEATPVAVEVGAATETTDVEGTAEVGTTDADTAKTSDAETEAATNSILKELLLKEGQPEVSTKRKTSADGVVDLSSSEDDEANKKKTGQEATSDGKEKDASHKKKSTAEETPISSEINDIPTVDEKGAKEASKDPAPNAEVFNLDSDEDDVPAIASEIIIEDKPESNKCINPSCRSGANTTYVLADAAARAYFDADKKKKHKVCLTCAEAVVERTKGLVNGIKDFTPLLELDLRKVSSETVEISDSDSDNDETEIIQADVIGESGAKFLEEHLADVINETWLKYKLDERLGDTQRELDKELAKLEADSKEIDTMLNECQVATDLLRNQLYATFEPERRELTPICIMDTPLEKYSYSETPKEQAAVPDTRLKRKASAPIDLPAKRAAIPLGYTPLEADDTKTPAETNTVDDDKDVSVVKLSAEAAPSDLPPPGEIVRQALRPGMSVFAMRNSFCTWVPGKVMDVQPKNPGNPFTMCRIRFELRQKIATRVLAARCLAYIQPADVRLTIGTRVIALSQENAKADEASKKKTFYSGIVAEVPNPVNSYRYLIFFDHGYAQYVHHRDTRVVCESASLVWEEVHPNSREFVKQYLLAYPERPMVRLHAGQSLKTEWNGKWWVTKVLQVDASLVEVSFEDNRSEWIYRGSTRLAPLFLELQAAERHRSRPLPRSNQRRMNMPYVEYTRSEEQNKAEAAEKARQEQHNEEMRRQRAVAKKSTALPTPPPTQTPHSNLDSVTSRVVYYTPKNAVKPLKLAPHTCSPKCKRSDVLALKDLRTYNPLAKPLLSGWERQIVRFKGHKEVMYRAPCGRRLRNMRELHRYLRAIQSDMGVDLFDFGANTHCLAEFVLNKCLVGKKDLSHGKENVPVPCVNYYDESLPEFCSYNTERTPTAGVPLNLDPEFLCGCDCTDDCEDKSKCACWKMTLEGARTIGLQGGHIGYEYKRLPEPLPSGIYECNSRCKCKQTCLNRVAQHPLQLKLQVFKTMNRGWGIRALNDVPKGSFLCVYAGNLLTDATANLDGLNEGDEYLAELDYIEVVEQMKEGYEEDIPEADKKQDRASSKSSSEQDEPSSEEEDNSNDKEDGDFQPGYIGLGLTEFNKRLRKRDRTRKKDAAKEKGKEIEKGMEEDGCITISDDEEAKEPAQFTAQTGIGANDFVSKYKSVRTLFGKDEACYIMDAKVQGNIGRYLNHSCTPNVFVQNVFVDTHDPRFPWVAFFALSHIRAGTELTWNYNYDVGSVPGKVLYCYCGALNCRGRLL